MARPRNEVPAYKKHPTKPEARCWVGGRWLTLGRWGTPEARAAYQRVCAELAVAPERASSDPRKSITVAEVTAHFLRFAISHYRGADGENTTEVRSYREAMRTACELYGAVPATEFGPLALRAVRERFVGKGWCRVNVNRQVGRVRRVFKWAAGEQLVPSSVHLDLACVQGLQKGRTAVRESEPVQPVDDAAVDATLPHLNRTVRGMVEFQRLTGCRPAEACCLRRADIDTSGDVWVYRPPHHKNSWRGKERPIPIGPRAQALLANFPTADPTEYVFSPRRAVAELHAARTANRKTPRYPSHLRLNERRRVASPGRQHAEMYTTTAYDLAIRRAVVKANDRRERLAGGGNFEPVPHWAPNQIRHTVGTEVRRQFGVEAAQVLLGHANVKTTEIYAEKNLALGCEVAGRIG